MIEIIIKDNEFSYDMKALSLAFFPEQDCLVRLDSSISSIENVYSVICNIDGERLFEENIPVPYTKNQVKRIVYFHFLKKAGKGLLWGILTGIRPSKIPLRMMMSGMELEKIHQLMLEEYLVEPEKAKLAMDIAWKEYSLTKNLVHEECYSIYVGIPFCPTRCHYCSFAAYPMKQYHNRVDEYLDALEKEIKYGATVYPNRRLTSVYIGGGTPTALNEIQFERLLTMVKTYLPWEHVLEFTVEAGRPDSITVEKLKAMKRHNVSRISINPQTMKASTLELMGRNHTVESIVEVFNQARQVGFDNINMDFIVGLPGETWEDFQRSLAQVKVLDPDSITIHTLVIKRASKMREDQMGQEDLLPEEDVIPRMQEYGQQYASENGYEPYYMYRQKNKAGVSKNTNQENIGYAKPGKECYYNIFIMEELETILALGAGGSSKYVYASKNQMERVENVKSIEDYIGRIDEMIERKKSHMKQWDRRD